MSTTSIAICLKNQGSPNKPQAPGVYAYIGSSGKQKVTLELS